MLFIIASKSTMIRVLDSKATMLLCETLGRSFPVKLPTFSK